MFGVKTSGCQHTHSKKHCAAGWRWSRNEHKTWCYLGKYHSIECYEVEALTLATVLSGKSPLESNCIPYGVVLYNTAVLGIGDIVQHGDAG